MSADDLFGTPSTITDIPIDIQMFDQRLLVPPNGSPRSTMANTEGQDPNEELHDRQKVVLQVPAVSFASADKELLESGKYADAKIIAHDKTYNVHKNILCTRSKWFRKVLDGAFRSLLRYIEDEEQSVIIAPGLQCYCNRLESLTDLFDFQEGQESVVEISAPDNIERVLEFLYTGTVDLSTEADLMIGANELFVLGDFYLVKEMRTFAVQVLGNYLGEFLNSICDVKQLPTIPAEYAAKEYWSSLPTQTVPRIEHNFEYLQEQGFIDRLCVAIRDAYATPSGIHHVYVDFVYAARTHTFKNQLIRNLRDEIPEFGYDILTALMTGPQSSAFQGNTVFQQWQDGLTNPEAAAAAEPDHVPVNRTPPVASDRRRDWPPPSVWPPPSYWIPRPRGNRVTDQSWG